MNVGAAKRRCSSASVPRHPENRLGGYRPRRTARIGATRKISCRPRRGNRFVYDGAASDQRYPGQYYDQETGLHQNYFRTYDPSLGRYREADPIGLEGGSNRYAYVSSNPLGLIDPLGLFESNWFLRSVVPGQVRFDAGMTALENGQHGWAAFNFGVMLGEQVLYALTLGQVGLGKQAGQCAITAAEETAATGLQIPKVADPRLRNLVNDLFKGAKGPNPIGTGSTADAVRRELATGEPTHGYFHSQKAAEYARALEKWIANNPNASYYDKLVARSLANDLRNSLKGL